MSAPKERSIVFSDAYVRAILDGRKSQTRKVVKPQPPQNDPPLACEWYTPAVFRANGEIHEAKSDVFGAYGAEWGVKCPFGAPGDRLWVREAFTLSDADCQAWDLPEARAAHEPLVFYRADVEGPLLDVKWNPSVLMPKWASRITLEITSVRVERLQEISLEDAKAEGAHKVATHAGIDNFWSMERPHPCEIDSIKGPSLCLGSPQMVFAQAWDQLNNKPGRRWDNNPFVWVIGFKRVKL